MTESEIQNPRLRELAEATQAARAQAKLVVGSLSRAQLDWQPAPGRWSVGQCLEHLLISSEAMEKAVRPKLAAARQNQGAASSQEWKPSFVGGLLVKSVDPVTGKRKVKTGRVFMPGPVARPDVLAAFERSLDMLNGLLREADGVDLARVRVTSPMSWFVRYHAGDALTITVVHLKRHLDQAERVKAEPGFPGT